MDTWEHMRIEAVYKGTQTIELRIIAAPRYFPSDVDNDHEPGDQGMRLLEQYANAGWELVTVETAPTGSALQRTYWLKRRVVAEQSPGLAFGIA